MQLTTYNLLIFVSILNKPIHEVDIYAFTREINTVNRYSQYNHFPLVVDPCMTL